MEKIYNENNNINLGLNYLTYPILFKEVWRMTGVPDTLIPSDPDIILWVSILSVINLN